MKNINTQIHKQGSRYALAALGLALTSALPAHAHAFWGGGPTSDTSKTDQALTQALAAPAKTGATNVIIKTAGILTKGQEAQMTALGADITRHLPFIQSVALRVPTKNLSKLAALPFVTHLSYDGQIKKCDEFTVGSSGAGTAYQQYGLDGTGVTVAVVDSGICGTSLTKTGRDIIRDASGGSSRLLACTEFCADDNNIIDDCGHGTHVAGIIAGNGYSSTGNNYYRTFYGIARNANLVSVKVLNSIGQGSVSQVISGLQWVVANKKTYNIRVINLSLGHPVGESYTTDPLCQAVEAAYKAGIVVICAAGNSGRAAATQTSGASNEGWGTAYGSITSPGNDPYVITVGATKSMDGNRAHDRIATYSSRGPSRLDLVLKPDIIAPGNRVISVDSNGSYLDNYAGGTNDIPLSAYVLQGNRTPSNAYYCLSGTSMATPVVAGAAALLLQKYPNLSPDTIKARLMLSADKWADPSGNGDPCTYGAGYLDIPAALQNAAVATAPANSPTLTRDLSGNVLIDTSHCIWGTHVIWGTSGLTDLHVIWGTCLLGTNTLTASHVIWGTSIWCDHVIWGTSTSAVDLSSIAIKGE